MNLRPPAAAGQDSPSLEVTFTPAEFAALKYRDLSATACVVFDVLRATSTMITALANGAKEIIPVLEISEALAIRAAQPTVLLAGERDGLRIRAAQSGGIDFDLGNSPREFDPKIVRGKTIVMTTTNGTRALRASAHAQKVLVGGFLNLSALADWITRHKPSALLLICAGTFEEAAYEDTLAAGALVELVAGMNSSRALSDSAQMARQIFLSNRTDLIGSMPFSKNARRLRANPDLNDDVAFCLERDRFPLVPGMRDGSISVSDVLGLG
jgi:2-phosphosulfolactate phosphatase